MAQTGRVMLFSLLPAAPPLRPPEKPAPGRAAGEGGFAVALRGRRAAKCCVVCLLCLLSTLALSWELTTSRMH